MEELHVDRIEYRQTVSHAFIHSFFLAVRSTLVYCYRYTNVGFVNSSTSAASWIVCKGSFIQYPHTANHQRLRLQWAHEHRAWQVHWHQVVFSNESRFNLWDYDGLILVRRSAGERCLPDNRYVREVLQLEVVPFHQGIPEAIFQQDSARPYVTKTVRDFCPAQHIQLLPWPAYSPDMSPIEQEWNLVGRHLAYVPRPAALQDELLLCIQEI
ncbi:transposable element Tcb1 transposase [Trichonephila clavipes]|nr:transposable element Tcb1 transposase [Trichonephila clavipes]